MVSMKMGGIQGSNFGWRLDCKSKTYGQTSETKSNLEADAAPSMSQIVRRCPCYQTSLSLDMVMVHVVKTMMFIEEI